LGLLAICLGGSLFVGSLIYGRLGQRLSHLKIIFICLSLSGLALFLFAILTYPCKEFWITGAS
jgi:predicted MFS family arabinose efflux permease